MAIIRVTQQLRKQIIRASLQNKTYKKDKNSYNSF